MTKSKIEIPSENEGFSLISNQKLLTLYAAMLRCRQFAIGSGNGNGKAGAGADSILGHEASVVGTTMDLLPHDTVGPSLWPDDLMRAVNPSVSVATGCSAATRSAIADKSGQKLTVLFSSRKRSSQLSWLKALALAKVNNLPVLFVGLDHEETFWKTAELQQTPLKRGGYALPTISVDGSDVVAVYRVACESIAHARKGHGPTLIQCRLSNSSDPVRNMEKYLIGKGIKPEPPSA